MNRHIPPLSAPARRVNGVEPIANVTAARP